jgi:hypothetical protein
LWGKLLRRQATTQNLSATTNHLCRAEKGCHRVQGENGDGLPLPLGRRQAMHGDSKSLVEQIKGNHLRVISSNEKQGQVETDAEMKAVLEDIKRRYRVMHERLDGDSDTPDAA